MSPRHNAAARTAISRRMKAYWAGRRAAKQQPVVAATGIRLRADARNRYAELGARVRLEQITTEQKEIERFLRKQA